MPTTQISILWEDVEGQRIRKQLNFDTSEINTVALAQTAMTTYETLLLAMSGAVIVDADVKFGLTLAGGQLPDNGYNVRSGAYLSFENSDTVGDGIYIPGILDDKVIDGVVDSSDGDVSAFIAEAIGGADPISTRGSGSKWDTYEGGFTTTRKT